MGKGKKKKSGAGLDEAAAPEAAPEADVDPTDEDSQVEDSSGAPEAASEAAPEAAPTEDDGAAASGGSKTEPPVNEPESVSEDTAKPEVASSEPEASAGEDDAAAAVRIQSVYRGHVARTECVKQEKEQEEAVSDLAATKIQAQFRGHSARQQQPKPSADSAAVVESVSESVSESPEEPLAVTAAAQQGEDQPELLWPEEVNDIEQDDESPAPPAGPPLAATTTEEVIPPADDSADKPSSAGGMTVDRRAYYKSLGGPKGGPAGPPSRSKKSGNMLKIIVLGDSGVGKTSLMNRYVDERFSTEWKATIGVDHKRKDGIKVDDGKKDVTVQIWDTAGQERFHSLGTAFYRGCDGCILVFDVTNYRSFDSLENWKEDFVLEGAPDDPKTFPFVVVGNKVDRVRSSVDWERSGSASCDRATVQRWCTREAEARGAKDSMEYFEASAKDGSGVDEAFQRIAELAYSRSAPDKPGKEGIKMVDLGTKDAPGTAESSSSGGCC